MAVQIEFGEKSRELKFDLAAIRDLEIAMNGRPLAAIVSDLGMAGVTALVAALWAGFKHEDRALSQNLVLKQLEKYLAAGKSPGKLARAVNDALLESGLFRNDEDDEGNAPPEHATT